MKTLEAGTLAPLLRQTPFQGYVYAYPHKTAYRPLAPPRPLSEVWAGERREALFLYVHVPFCAMRCGFCNLFTQAKPNDSLVALYLDALKRQAARVRDCLGEVTFARFAVGGGTPTYLDEDGLAAVFDLAEAMGADPRATPTCVEVSPETVTPGKLRLLKARGTDRVSIGIQSFIESETAHSGRPQKRAEVERTLGLIRETGFPTLNIDLIYGLPGQTLESWLYSLRAALAYEPEELYLYPLYVRPLTGLGRSQKGWDDVRLDCYRVGRDLLREAGYTQVSMRMFRGPHAPAEDGPVYCCQEDGMVGLGCGARSYTRGLHYSTEYAVGAKGVREIIAAFVARDEESFAFADHGFELDGAEQRRRFVLQSLLAHEGLDLARYEARFGSAAFDDLPQLGELEPLGLAREAGGALVLTPAGLERSDTIGPWLFSEAVRRRMAEHEAR